jgi:hypothetical protein
MTSNSPDVLPIFKALADATRIRMVGLMVSGPRCGQELASELGVSAATVSHHLRVLREAGLLTEERDPPYTLFGFRHEVLARAAQAVSDRKKIQKFAAGAGLADEKRKVLETFFDGARLVAIPAQRRKKEIVFEEILRRLPPREIYGERELSRLIGEIHPDFCTIRRELIMGRYMERDRGNYRLALRGRAALADGA